MSYTPGALPTDSIESLARALEDELVRISDALRVGEFDSINLASLSVSPEKPRDGDIINADGATFDPGSGKGAYEYRDGAYSKL